MFNRRYYMKGGKYVFYILQELEKWRQEKEMGM